MPADVIEAADGWQKARASQGTGACVELRKLDDGQVALRNSRFPSGPALVLTAPEIAALLNGVKSGEFDRLAV
ncbi:DUF397 domain-containing protein [Kitasatospora purpeofusca]|uniref:DUF397 domain-containing protein n=1 Tax=Kitasatospora purpeofusca TaxID=67352 RepID=UPI00386C7696|nr:DUF397 domain-containing protein [Kitasatospora purpeofusca]